MGSGSSWGRWVDGGAWLDGDDCQGRVCGYAAACLTSAWTGTPYDRAGFAERPIATPLTLGGLAEGEYRS